MRMFAGLDVGFKRTSVCVVEETGKIVWRGVVDTHPEMIAAALHRWRGEKVVGSNPTPATNLTT